MHMKERTNEFDEGRCSVTVAWLRRLFRASYRMPFTSRS